jgi:two-component system CheB/CheR fusion protein
MDATKKIEDLTKEVNELRIQLREANDTLEAIRTGQVDALIVESDKGHQLYTLKTADQTYRVFIEKMREGAVALSKTAIILYCNQQFANMVGHPVVKIIGMPFEQFVPEKSRDMFRQLFDRGWKSDSKGEIDLVNDQSVGTSFLLSFAALELDEGMASKEGGCENE